MNLRKQKELAARALGVPVSRVKFDTSAEAQKQFTELISRDGIKELVEEGYIKKIPVKGNSRTHANYLATQKKKGRRSGHGNRKGTSYARLPKKERWVEKIRALRALLKRFKEAGRLDEKTHRELYLKCKGNFFRNKRHLLLYIEQNNLLKEVKSDGKKQK